MDYESTPEFDAQFSKLTRKNKALEERLLKKINQIMVSYKKTSVAGDGLNEVLECSGQRIIDKNQISCLDSRLICRSGA